MKTTITTIALLLTASLACAQNASCPRPSAPPQRHDWNQQPRCAPGHAYQYQYQYQHPRSYQGHAYQYQYTWPAYGFNEYLQYARSLSFESARMNACMLAVDRCSPTPWQVRDLMSALSFESSRLELAKYAYTRCQRREAYHVTFEALQFDSSVQELIRHMRCFR